MSCRSAGAYELLPTTDELLPGEFYDLPEARRKTSLGPMLLFASIAYITSVIVFALLVVNTAKTYVKETTIMSHDATGSDGYTCEMISKVTNSFTNQTNMEPTTSFNLVNIIESKAQCLSNFQTSNPCNSPQSYLPGSSADIAYGTDFVAVGMYGSDKAYMIDPTGFLIVNNYVNGTMLSYPPIAYFLNAYSNTMGIDKHGTAYFLSLFCQGLDCTYQVIAKSPTHEAKVAFYDHPYTAIINDNYYNLYMYNNKTVYAMDFAADTQIPIFNLTAYPGKYIDSAAVFSHPNGATTVFFTSYWGGNFLCLYQYQDDQIWFLTSTQIAAGQPILFDGVQLIYFACAWTDQFTHVAINDICVYNTSDYNSADVHTISSQRLQDDVLIQSYALSADNTHLFITTTNSLHLTQKQYYYYPSTEYFEAMTYQYGFGAGWFTCGDNIIYPVPVQTRVYTSACQSNGVIGEVLYLKEYTYVFSPTDAAAYALRTSPSYCAALYNQVCNVVADLPPYSCTKKVYPTVFTVLGTAFANATLLLSVMLFLFGYMLSRLAKRYPPVGSNVHNSTGGTDSACTKSAIHSGGVEMADVA